MSISIFGYQVNKTTRRNNNTHECVSWSIAYNEKYLRNDLNALRWIDKYIMRLDPLVILSSYKDYETTSTLLMIKLHKKIQLYYWKTKGRKKQYKGCMCQFQMYLFL